MYVYVRGALSRATLLSKMCALEIGRAKRKSNDGKIKKTDRQYVTNETSRYKSHFVYNTYFHAHLTLEGESLDSFHFPVTYFELGSLNYVADAKNFFVHSNGRPCPSA